MKSIGWVGVWCTIPAISSISSIWPGDLGELLELTHCMIQQNWSDLYSVFLPFPVFHASNPVTRANCWKYDLAEPLGHLQCIPAEIHTADLEVLFPQWQALVIPPCIYTHIRLDLGFSLSLAMGIHSLHIYLRFLYIQGVLWNWYNRAVVIYEDQINRLSWLVKCLLGLVGMVQCGVSLSTTEPYERLVAFGRAVQMATVSMFCGWLQQYDVAYLCEWLSFCRFWVEI
jgi:hypothetical protein